MSYISQNSLILGAQTKVKPQPQNTPMDKGPNLSVSLKMISPEGTCFKNIP